MSAETNIQDVYSLSPMQEGILYHCLQDPYSGAYLIQTVYTIRGTLHIEYVQKSLEELSRRYDILRTVFVYREVEDILQVVLRDRSIAFTHKDLRWMSSGEEKNEYVQNFKEMDRTTPFDLSTDVMMRVAVLQLSDIDYVFIWNFHHILMDGWCMGILTDEYQKFYSGFVSGRHQRLPAVTQYKYYIEWLQAQDQQSAKKYWAGYLSGYSRLSSVPGRKEARAGVLFDLSEVALELDGARAGALSALALKYRVTTYTLLQAVWGILLSRYNNTDDVVFGSVVSGRPPALAGSETMVGLFINTVPVRVRYNAGATVGELLKQMQEHSLEGGQYHYCRLAEIQTETAAKQHLLDHIMVFENYPTVPPVFSSGDAGPAERRGAEEIAARESWDHANYSFFIVIVPGDGLRVRFCFDREMYDERFVAVIPGHFGRIVDQLLYGDGAEAFIGELSIVTEGEERELVEGFSGEEVGYGPEGCLEEMLEGQVRRDPGAIAVRCEGRELSYGELWDGGNRLGNWLRERYGLKRGELVGLMMERSEWMVLGMVGILKSGAGYVPIDPWYPEERKRYMIGDAGLRCVLTEGGLAVPEVLGCEGVDVAARWAEEIGLSSAAAVGSGAGWEDILYVIYTSGSTGRPKGCVIEQGGMRNLAGWHRRVFGVSAGSRGLVYAGIGFDASLWEVWPYLLGGGCLYPVKEKEKYELGLLVEKLGREGITHGYLPTRVCAELVGREGFGELGVCVLTGGEKLEWKEEWVGSRVVNNYGLSEATVVSTYLEVGEWKGAGGVPIGRPIDNTRVYILDKGMQLQPVGVEGEIWVSGAGVGRGYLNRGELTRERFVDNPYGGGSREYGRLYRTGDRGRWTPAGLVEYLGRRDRQVKVRGYRIELGEIEAELNRCAGVGQALVVVRGEGSDRRLVGYYRCLGEGVSREEVEGQLRERLPGYMVPWKLVEVEEYPLTGHGKLDESRLPEPEAAVGGDERAATVVEEELRVLWEEVLGVGGIGLRDNFFELGGHSIRAIQLVFQITRKLGVSLELTDIFERPTIEGLGRLLGERGRGRKEEEIGVVEEGEDYAVSHAQKRLWIIDQLEGEKTAYNIFGSYVLEGEVDRVSLERSFEGLVDRHESLRTVFVSRDGEPRQRVLSRQELGYRLKYVDLREEEDGEQRAREVSEEESVRGFDLSRGPLIRTKLLRVGERRYIFLLTLHHIVSDGWSMEVMVRELLALYEGYCRGEAVELKALRIQYKDYAAWQNRLLSGAGVGSHRAYWLERLGGELPVLELPADYGRPQVKRNNGSVIGMLVDKGLREGLQRKSQEKGLTMFMLLVAGVKVLLHRYSGQEDIIVGTPIAGREHMDLEDQIGFYVNTLALRSRVRGELRVEELLEAIRETMVGAYAHQSYPFDRLVEELEVVRDMSRMPVFDVLVVYQNMELGSGGPGEMSGITVGEYAAESTVSKYDLSFLFRDLGDGVSVEVEYSTDLFGRGRMERLLQHYRGVLEGLAGDGQVRIGELGYLGEGEREQLLKVFNGRESSYPKESTVTELFERGAAEWPERTAVVCEGRELSYGELNERSNRLGSWLRKRYGVGPDELIGIMADRSEWMIIGILGILKSGAGYVPIDADYPPERKRFMVEDAELRCLLVDGADEGEDYETEVIHFRERWEEEIGRADEANPERINTAKDIAYVIYTSGSTGRPKGCVIDNEGTISRIHWAWYYYGFDDSDSFLQRTPLIFDVSVWEIFISLLYGAKLVLCSKDAVYEPDTLAELVARYQITNIYFVPALLNAFLENLKAASISKLGTLRRVMVSGEVLTLETVRRYYELIAVPLINFYGPTEASVNVTHFTTSVNDRMIPIGKPIDNVKLYIVDKHMAPVPIGIPGEICIGGTGVARGYKSRPDVTALKFVDDPFEPGKKLYKTGDTGAWLEDGNIQYLGRNDSQIKLRGYRIELQEIEAVMSENAGVESAVAAVRGDDWGKYLVGYYKAAGISDEAELRQHLQQKLPAYMVPAYLVKVPAFVLTASGKIDRNNLPGHPGPIVSYAGGYAPPDGQVEILLATIWKELLSLPDISVNTSFFELGGNSLKMISLRTRLTALGFVVEMPLLYRFVTIRTLAAAIGEQYTPYPAEQPFAGGQAALTSMQQAFVRSDTAAGSYCGWTLTVHAPGRIDREGMYVVMAKLLEHHDALRMYFDASSGMAIVDAAAALPGAVIEYDLRSEQEPKEKLRRQVALSQLEMQIGNPPLIRLLLFRMQDGDRLVLLVHEFIFDEYSWKILIRDFTRLYRQHLDGEEPQLGPGTGFLPGGVHTLTRAAEGRPAGKKGKAVHTVKLDHKSTRLVLSVLPRSLDISPEGILVSALGLAVKRSFAPERVLIDLRRDGRGKMAPGADTQRAIGSFFYVMSLAMPDSGEDRMSGYLSRVREVLNTSPEEGMVDYRPGISFGYAGRLDEDVQDNLEDMVIESFSRETWGIGMAPELLIDVFAAATGEFLETTIIYDDEMIAEEDILCLKDNYHKILMELAYTALSSTGYERPQSDSFGKRLLSDLLQHRVQAQTRSAYDVHAALLKQIWAKVLQLNDPGFHDDFFRLGGVSVLTIFGVFELYRELGLELKLADIFNYPTIHRLAVYLHERQPDKVRNIVELAVNRRNRPSVLLIPPADGLPNLFLALADLLKDRLDCYGYLFGGFYDDHSLPSTRDELVRQIAREVCEDQRLDELLIVGYSWSGSIAFEVAKELEAAGKMVKLVIIDLSIDHKIFGRQVDYTLEELEQAFEIDKADLAVYFKNLVKRVALNNYRLFTQYRTVGRINADILYMAAREGERDLDLRAWSAFTSGELTVRIADGNHWNILEISFRQISAAILEFAGAEYSKRVILSN